MVNCEVFEMAGLIGKKWTIVVLQEVELNGGKGFNFIYERMGKISPKILSSRLKELESKGLIEKKVLSSKPLKTLYKLTEKGKDFQSIINNIKQCGTRYSKNKIECGKKECVTCTLY